MKAVTFNLYVNVLYHYYRNRAGETLQVFSHLCQTERRGCLLPSSFITGAGQGKRYKFFLAPSEREVEGACGLSWLPKFNGFNRGSGWQVLHSNRIFLFEIGRGERGFCAVERRREEIPWVDEAGEKWQTDRRLEWGLRR